MENRNIAVAVYSAAVIAVTIPVVTSIVMDIKHKKMLMESEKKRQDLVTATYDLNHRLAQEFFDAKFHTIINEDKED